MKEIKKVINLKKYYYILLVGIIIVEIYLIINASRQIDENKIIIKTKINNIIKKKSNISNLALNNEKLEKEIKIFKTEQLNSLQLLKSKNENLIEINKNISKLFHINYEEYENREKLFEFKIEEDNETLNELINKLNNKTLIRNNLEKELDILEEKIYKDIPDIKMKSSILDSDNEKINLLARWISSLNIGKIKKYKFIFSAKDYNFDSFYFHEICGQDITNTLIIIKTENNEIIGGFTFASWEANSLLNYDDKAFIFNLNQKQKFRISNPSCAINSRINEGPMFGVYDLISNGNKMKVQEKMESYGDNNLGLKQEVISIVNYEVFNVIFD